MEVPRLLDGRLKVRHLMLMDALARQGTVVGAAAELHVTQPAATRGLHELEEILGVPLFERGPRGITSTVFGEAFLQHARAVLAQLNQAGRHVVELAEADRGLVIAGSHLAGSNLLLPRAIAAVKREHPFLTVAMHTATHDALLIELAAGRVDLVVGRLTEPSDEQFLRRPLVDERVALVVRAGHPFDGRTELDLAELIDQPWVLPGHQTVLRREVEELLARHGFGLPANRVESSSFLTVRQLLLETDVVAVLPSMLVREDTRLVRLPVLLEQVGHNVGLTLSATRPLSPSTRVLVEALDRAAADLAEDAEPAAPGHLPR